MQEGKEFNAKVFLNPIRVLRRKIFGNFESDRKGTEIVDALTDEWTKLTNEILAKNDPPEGEMPFWHALRTLIHPETNETIAFNTLLAEIATLLVAATDTVGHQISWMVSLLSSHPNIVDKILNELEEHGLYGIHAREV